MSYYKMISVIQNKPPKGGSAMKVNARRTKVTSNPCDVPFPRVGQQGVT
jgi:hypothetical protein